MRLDTSGHGLENGRPHFWELFGLPNGEVAVPPHARGADIRILGVATAPLQHDTASAQHVPASLEHVVLVPSAE